jgi:hypothetical protein
MYLGFFHALEKAAVNTKTRKWAQAWVILISTLHLAVGFYSWRHKPVLYTRQQFVRLLHAGGGANHFYRKQHDDASQEVSSPTRFLSWRLEAPVLRYRFVKWGKHTHVWKCPCMTTILWFLVMPCRDESGLCTTFFVKDFGGTDIKVGVSKVSCF